MSCPNALCGSGCARCQFCGRVNPRRRRRRAVSAKSSSVRSRPAHLQYVYYHPSASATAGWTGVASVPAAVRVPEYRTYARAVALRDVRNVANTGVRDKDGLSPNMLVRGRKRKISD